MPRSTSLHRSPTRRAGGRIAGEPSVVVAGVPISHPDKLYWPDEGITKRHLAEYYTRLAPRLLPWMKDRPLTMERCPPPGLASTVPTVAIRAAPTGKDLHYVVGGARTTLLALVNLGCIAVHVMASRTDALRAPDWLAFDFDPQTGAFGDAARAGLSLKRLLDDLGIESFAKTSGGRGLHVFVPLRRGPNHDAVRGFASAVSALLVAREPRLVTTESRVASRKAPVYLDVMRNAFGQTIVPPYSARHRPRAPVSTPLDWREVDPRLDPAGFNIHTIEKRLAVGDPWRHFWKRRQTLPHL